MAVGADLSQTLVKPEGGRKQKNGPGNRGHDPFSEGWGRLSDRACSQKSCICRAQRPKRGRSPVRMAMRLLAVRRRSMEAITRANRVPQGTRPMDAVLDMFVPFSWCGTIPRRVSGQFMYTRCQLQQACLHSS